MKFVVRVKCCYTYSHKDAHGTTSPYISLSLIASAIEAIEVIEAIEAIEAIGAIEAI